MALAGFAVSGSDRTAPYIPHCGGGLARGGWGGWWAKGQALAKGATNAPALKSPTAVGDVGGQFRRSRWDDQDMLVRQAYHGHKVRLIELRAKGDVLPEADRREV